MQAFFRRVQAGETAGFPRVKPRHQFFTLCYPAMYLEVQGKTIIGDLSQRQMVIKKQEDETPKERRKRRIRNRLVYNDWGLYGFVQMLAYKCLRFGKELHIISERDTTKRCHVCKHKQDMSLWVRTYRCGNCGLVIDRDENSAVNIYLRFLAGLPPHTSAI